MDAVGIAVICVAVVGGFVMRVLRLRSRNTRDDQRRQRRDERRREHHFRGSLDFELEKGRGVQPTDDASA